jgi:hypothetical protein
MLTDVNMPGLLCRWIKRPIDTPRMWVRLRGVADGVGRWSWKLAHLCKELVC